MLPFSLRERSGVPEDQGKYPSVLAQTQTDDQQVQWWNSFIFAVFGGAILIGSRKSSSSLALQGALTEVLSLQRYVVGSLTVLPNGPSASILVSSSSVQQLSSSDLLKPAGSS